MIIIRWSEQITLIAPKYPNETERTNEHGFPIETEEATITVFADKKSVGYSEFYKAEIAGHTVEMKFDIRAFEYNGETIAEYPVSSGKRYRILRTYLHNEGEMIELTLADLPKV